MELSIILPCLNEIRHGYLERILNNLVNQVGEIEIIVAVSPSEDDTEIVLEAYAQRYANLRIVRSLARNRAQRFNDGIAVSQGEIILLHHPATILPEAEILAMIKRSLSTLSSGHSNPIWGAFHHSFDDQHWLLKFTSWYSNQVRAKQKGIVYFDHCPFIYREFLVKIGNIPDLDIFEDTVLSDRLRQFTKPLLADGTAITSARRFRQRGIYRHAMLNQLLKLCYHLKINPKHLNRLYEKRYSINTKY